ncbi:MAG: M48 family metallopeptidase [Eggerthellaceae bacterium]
MPAVHSEELLFVEDLEVWVSYKNVKNLSVRVLPPDGRIQVSAPASLGREHISQFIASKHDWLVRSRERVMDSPMSRAERASKQEVEQWRALVKAFVPPLVAKWEPIMGVKAGELAYRNMKSRWGSCQPSTGRICINIRLALFPPECLEYVVVHELCHLLEFGHGPRFKALMDAFLPNWREAKKKLS